MFIDGFNIVKDGTYIIAEIGSNHNQDKQLAYDTIDAAIECGANAVKFQSIDVNELYYSPSSSTIKLHKKIDLKESWHFDLKSYCDSKGITFFSTPTYLKAIDILEELDVSVYKLASAQVGTFPQLVRRVAELQKPTLLSTGIVNLDELKAVINIFKEVKNPNYIILHCNSMYPVSYNKVNLGLINTYQKQYDTVIGFSDHSIGTATAVAAVAMGAKVIEKHFTLSRRLPVPDASFSLEPDDFKEMVNNIRVVDQCTKNLSRQTIDAEELAFKNKIQYRLVLKQDVKRGDVIKEDHFNYLRFDSGIPATETLKVTAKFNKNIAKGVVLDYNDISV